MAEVNVDLPTGAYNIHIIPGEIGEIGRLVAGVGLAGKALVVSDEIVGALYGEVVLKSLKRAGCEAELICVPPGENSKDLAVAMELYTKAVMMGLDRHSPVVALGGGVVGDLAGFVAATYMRGVPFIQIPTTLLAQVDSSVGGKVAVNHPLGKNLIGAFYQPRLVLADINVLNTLPERELSAGLAEVVKYGIIADAALFKYLQDNYVGIKEKDQAVLTKIVSDSCNIKARVVEQDEKESYLRMILNFGHTIGHAVEAATEYSRYKHGEAVAIGMHGAALISYYMGLCSVQTVDSIKELLKAFELPLVARECCADELSGFLNHDKKNVGGLINWVLINNAIGEVVIQSDVPKEVICRVLSELT
ncbi:MAG: aroB [Firmicutes bacterium]|nr:aroB [Bacillota bacterium]